MDEKLVKYQENCVEELHALIEALVKIPAPTFHEEERAKFCKDWLEKQGATGVYVDEAKNCVFPMNCDGKDDIVVFTAHTDTVFPDLEPFEMRRDERNFYAPGVGDDTANLAIMLMVVKFILQNNLKPKRGVLFVATACEEGLGHNNGSRQIMKDYAGRISEFYSFDGRYPEVTDLAIGAHRYEVECKTVGGHSYGDFRRPGRKSAIEELTKLIYELYQVKEPKVEGFKTTYNVGTIEGGSAINALAQSAKMCYEYRSDDLGSLEFMEKTFKRIVERANEADDVEFSYKLLGEVPCAKNVDREKIERMIAHVVKLSDKYHPEWPCKVESGTTDCNIPLSMGIPAVCLGLIWGHGAHRREEYLEIASLPIGLRIASELILESFDI